MTAKVFLIGNVGKIEAETKGGYTFAKLSVAVKRYDFSKKEKVTDWHYLSIFGDKGDNALKVLNKGDFIYIDGELEIYKYDVNGKERSVTQIRVREWGLISRPKTKEGDPPANYQAPAQPVQPVQQEHGALFEDLEDDDIPF